MWIYLLSSEHYPGGRKQYRDVRALLRAYGGTHVFVDNIRVVPYGDPGDDWVGMNAMRAASPELSPTTQSAIGYVAVHAQPALRQKTDRSGFLSSPTFAALREFVRASIRWQQSVRVSRRTVLEEDQTRKHLKEVKRVVEDLGTVLTGLDQAGQAKANALVTKLIDQGNAQQKRLRRELELYRTMGTAGIAASVFAHEAANNPLANLRGALESIRFKVDQAGSQMLLAAVAPVIDRGLQDIDGLESVAKITLALVKARNRRQVKLNVTDVIAGVLTIFKPYFTLHQVTVSPPKAQRADIFGSRAALECILVNLLTNALQAFERQPPDIARIDIEVISNGKLVEIDVSDSGPGIVGPPMPMTPETATSSQLLKVALTHEPVTRC
jgi:C4-dicarboxylate-specific signal transduction histidine kinase